MIDHLSDLYLKCFRNLPLVKKFNSEVVVVVVVVVVFKNSN